MKQHGLPPLRRFSIIGLHGYRDVTIVFDHHIKIVAAENGTGKTTLLNALHAFLNGALHRLTSLEFDRIECEMSGLPQTIVVERSLLADLPNALSPRVMALAAEAEVPASDFLQFLTNDYSAHGISALRDHPIVEALYANTPLGYDEIDRALIEALDSLRSGSHSALHELPDKIKDALGGAEIVYLPTYRRIEAAQLKGLMRGQETRPRLRQSRQNARFSSDLLGPLMNFGLADVEERLAALTSELQRRSNHEYRSISAAIVDELLRGDFESNANRETLPELDALQLFLSRVSRDDQAQYRLNTLRSLYETGDINRPDNLVLRYFLGRLNKVVDQTRNVEKWIQTFVDVVGAYFRLSSDEKDVQYDPQAMKVLVRNQFTKNEIRLDDLSSGEKQIVSLFARLHLYPDKKIVLIDEPELSLSIDWQKRLLPDVVAADSCVQLLAITHSPFIFDNSLDEFAGQLSIKRRGAASAAQSR